MVEYVFNDKKLKVDTRVVFVDKKTNKISDKIKESFSKDEIKLCEKVIKKGFDNKDNINVLTDTSEIILFAFDAEAKDASLQKIGAKFAKSVFKSKKVNIYIDKLGGSIDDLILGFETGKYRFNKYFTKDVEDKESNIDKINFITDMPVKISKGLSIASGVNFSRDLINEPANILTPESFAKIVVKFKKAGLKIEVLEQKELKKLGLNLLLAVAQGSEKKPRVVVISWNGNPKKKDYDLTLVGKGVTFDSGGLSLKPSNSMEGMHTDMGGAAAVCGTIKAISDLKINKNVLGIIGLVENMPSGNAYRVNDIIKSMSGQTVEVLNTDAEGRLVLADMLTYVQKKYKAKKIVDLATLTGAVSMLFGPVYAGLFSNDKDMIENLTASGEKTGDRLWNLPLDDYFNKAMDSTYADMQNIGKHRVGGGSQGACFLKRFIEEGTNWAHLDIAGVAREALDDDLYAKGGTGFGVKLLVDYIENLK